MIAGGVGGNSGHRRLSSSSHIQVSEQLSPCQEHVVLGDKDDFTNFSPLSHALLSPSLFPSLSHLASIHPITGQVPVHKKGPS